MNPPFGSILAAETKGLSGRQAQGSLVFQVDLYHRRQPFGYPEQVEVDVEDQQPLENQNPTLSRLISHILSSGLAFARAGGVFGCKRLISQVVNLPKLCHLLLMIRTFHIKHFRGFDRLRLAGLKAVNLIGGLNNAGKTALLEALLLSSYPGPDAVRLLRRIRNERDELIGKLNGKVWNYFFYEQDKSKPVEFKAELEGGGLDEVSISTDFDVGEAIKQLGKTPDASVEELLVQKINNSVPLLISRNGNGKILIADSDDNKIGLVVSRSSREGEFSTPPFLPASLRMNDVLLTELVSEIKWDSRYKQLMEIMSQIDSRITGLDIDSRGGQPQLIVVVNGNQPMPMSMFGDAVRKLVELWLVVLTTPNKLLLIDEFENGIHFTRFEFLFTKLFETALGRGIQIFATTHSAELIAAYNHAAQSNPKFEAEAAYVEMSRLDQTGPITAAVLNMARLNYELKTHSTFRGE